MMDIAEMGYLSPGHGLKGKLNPLSDDEDLQDMYAEYKSKREIMIRCIVYSTSHSKSDSSIEKRHTKCSLILQKRFLHPLRNSHDCAQKIKDG